MNGTPRIVRADARDVNASVGERIGRLRKAEGWSLRQLSDLTEHHGKRIPASTLQRIEKGGPSGNRNKLSAEDLWTLCRVFQRTADDLLRPLDDVDRELARRIARKIADQSAALGRACEGVHEAMRELVALHTLSESESGLGDVIESALLQAETYRKQNEVGEQHPDVQAATQTALRNLTQAAVSEAGRALQIDVYRSDARIVELQAELDQLEAADSTSLDLSVLRDAYARLITAEEERADFEQRNPPRKDW